MTPHPKSSLTENLIMGAGVFAAFSRKTQKWFKRLDSLAAFDPANSVGRWTNRALIIFILLFAISVPHSIAAAQVSFGLSCIAWLLRDVSSRQRRFERLPIDLPLVFFAALTTLSSIFSIEPAVSLIKLKALTLFGIVYLISTNLHRRGVSIVMGLLFVSALAGVGFSLGEKVYGRGVIINAIEAGSPLASGVLRPGDVIWMIGRDRVYSPEEIAGAIRSRRTGETLNIEALHAGDPVPVKLTVTEEMKASVDPLGIVSGGRSRQFRIAGFSRQFFTYAEQMQILGMLAFGGLLAGIRSWRQGGDRKRFVINSCLFILFAAALVLTASRAVIAAFILAVLFVSIAVGGRLAPVIALVAALVLSGFGYYVITSARQPVTLSFSDDSASRRIAYMQSGLRLIPQHPLLGVGMDSHKKHWREWGFPGDYVTHTHSTPIQIAMDRGLPALASYVWLVVAMMLLLWRGYKRARAVGDLAGEGLRLGVFGSLIGFSASSLTNYNFGDSEALMLLLLVAGLGIIHSKSETSSQS
jgi:hypothetical protein